MIIKRLLLFFGILFMATACNQLKGPDKPKNLITKDKMVDILIDAKFITSGSSKNKLIMRDSGLNVNTYVYERHQVDSLQFALSNDYYAFHVEDYEEIYTRIADSLTALKDALKIIEADEWKAKNKRAEDSLAKILIENKENKDSFSLKEVKLKDSLQIDNERLEESIKEIEGLLEPISDSVFR
ncbi:DUF4296 domain-containing protein [Algibacter sp.]|uniref:DUF4296 domain-containing protein n=1 Tax=Algibacter sp. TaxID=1872428 RepID=UPI003C735596